MEKPGTPPPSPAQRRPAMTLIDDEDCPEVVCANCGDNPPTGVDCATELCELCFEYIMGSDEGFEP